jgi:peptidoglycan/LPS O-acetylase OafA/YrhL
MGILRLLLALSVAASHGAIIWKFNLVGGELAVQAFFIISGFYMSLILNEKYIGKNKSYKLFITNRLLRIYPVYWVVLIFVIISTVAVAILTKGHTLGALNSYTIVKPNAFSMGYFTFTNLFFGQDTLMFLGINPLNGSLFFTSHYASYNPAVYTYLFIPPAWSLGIELSFYLIAPFILRKGLKIVLIFIVLSLGLRFFLFNCFQLHSDPWTCRFFPTEIFFFLLGYVGYRLYLLIKKKPPSKFSLIILPFIILFTILYPILPSFVIQYFPFSNKDFLYIISITFSVPVLFYFFKKSKFDNQCGELSYPVYISHLMIISIAKNLPINFLKFGWVQIIIVIIFSIILNRYISIPLEKYRQARLKR